MNRSSSIRAVWLLLPLLILMGPGPKRAMAQCQSGAYIANPGDNTVSVIDTTTRTVIATIPGFSGPGTAAVHPDGTTVYVPNNIGSISVIDTFTNAIVDTIPISRVRGLAVTPDGSELWGANINDDTISVIDTETNVITNVIPGGIEPNFVAIHPDGSTAYVSNQAGGVTVVDVATKTVTTTVALGGTPIGLSVSPDGSEVWVARFVADRVSVISTATNTVTNNINAGNGPSNPIFHPDGSTVYVPNLSDSNVAVVDAVTKAVTNTIPTSGVNPLGGDIEPDGSAVYVCVTGNNSVDVIDTTSETVVDTILSGGSSQTIGTFITPVAVPSPIQTVYLDFGQIGVPFDKPDKDLLNADSSTLGTMLKGPRAGFDPEDLGFAPGTDRNELIRAIVARLRAAFTTLDGQLLSICFEGRIPNAPEFTTISIVEGSTPSLDLEIDPPLVDPTTDMEYTRTGGLNFTISGGTSPGYMVRIGDGQLRRPDDSIVPDVFFPELMIADIEALGAAQLIDPGNTEQTGKGWIFVGEHADFGSPQNNLNELTNSIAHELGHLLGLEHTDGVADSLMGPNLIPGQPASFSFNSRRKLAEILPPGGSFFGFAGTGTRVREARIGDIDQHGTSEIGPITGDPDADAASIFRAARAVLQSSADLAEEPFEFPLADLSQSDSEDGLFTDNALLNDTIATYDLDLGTSGILGNLVGARLEVKLLNVADTLGGSDDFRVFVDGFELAGALDGFDQRLSAPEFVGYGSAETVTLFLDDFLTFSQLDTILADGILNVEFHVDGETPFMSVDSILAVVTDNGPFSLSQCGLGAVNLGGGMRDDVLFVNGSAGGEMRTVAIEESDEIWAAMLLPPFGGNGKFFAHLNLGEPDETSLTVLPNDIGTVCFSMLLNQGAAPDAVFNALGKEQKIGASSYFGNAAPDPERAPTIFLQLPFGDAVNLPVGTKATMQGVIIDPNSPSSMAASATNAVILSIE